MLEYANLNITAMRHGLDPADTYERMLDALVDGLRQRVAVASVTDERAQEYDSSLHVRGWMPSLYLSLADDHRRLGEMERARSVSDVLGDDPYGVLVTGALEDVAAALADGLTERLSGNP